jgi:hypothetical protein
MKELFIRNFKSFNLQFKDKLSVALVLRKEELFNLLIAKINKDIIDKIEQEVELIAIDLAGENQLSIKGRAGAMGIKKEFTIHSFIVVNAEENKISIKVNDMEIQGGFLVQKGFSLVENKIREKIEEKAVVSITDLLKNIPSTIGIPGTENSIQLDVDKFDLNDLTIAPDGEDLVARVGLNEMRVGVRK